MSYSIGNATNNDVLDIKYVVTTNQYSININDSVHKQRDTVSDISPQLWFDNLT